MTTHLNQARTPSPEGPRQFWIWPVGFQNSALTLDLVFMRLVRIR
jgi:hypothetical protein